MLSKKRLLFFVSSISVILASPILQDGSQDFETEAFTLTLDNSNQVATSLTVKSGQNAGSQDFSTLLMRTVNRTDDGFNVSAASVLILVIEVTAIEVTIEVVEILSFRE